MVLHLLVKTNTPSGSGNNWIGPTMVQGMKLTILLTVQNQTINLQYLLLGQHVKIRLRILF
jgi:hypothetical protein